MLRRISKSMNRHCCVANTHALDHKTLNAHAQITKTDLNPGDQDWTTTTPILKPVAAFLFPGVNLPCGISTLSPGLRPERRSAPLARGQILAKRQDVVFPK